VSGSPEPKVVARRCHEKKKSRERESPAAEGEIREASEILIRSQQTDERALVTETWNCLIAATLWIASEEKGQNAEMGAGYKSKGKKLRVQPAERPIQRTMWRSRKLRIQPRG